MPDWIYFVSLRNLLIKGLSDLLPSLTHIIDPETGFLEMVLCCYQHFAPIENKERNVTSVHQQAEIYTDWYHYYYYSRSRVQRFVGPWYSVTSFLV